MLKNFCFKVYPLSLDLKERWYLSFLYTDSFGKVRPKKEAVSFKLKTVEARYEEIERMKTVIEAGYKPKQTAKKLVAANTATKKLKEELDKHKIELKKKSVSCYKTHIKKFDEYCKEAMIEVVSDTTAKDFLNYLRIKGLSGTTINNYRRTLKSYFKKLRNSKVVNKNVFDDTKKRKESGKSREYFRISQRKTILEWCELNDKPLVFAIKLIFYCFIRPGNELTGLRVCDVNLDDAILRVGGDVAKNDLTERVKIPNQLLTILEAMDLHKYPQDYFLVGKDGIPTPFQASIGYWNKRHRKALNGVGIFGRKQQWSIYSWKDAGAVQLHKNNVPMRLLQLQLRHKNLTTTSKYLSSFGLNELSELGDVFSDI
jgi:integrase